MAINNIKISILSILLLMGVLKIFIVHCLRIVPERAEMTYINHKYLKYARFYINRYSRRGLYYVNFEIYNYHTWTNNVSMHLVYNEYLHNEYRRSFVEMHYRFCDLINKDPYLGLLFRMYNITCPTPPDNYNVVNMTIPSQTFPNIWPFKKACVDFEFSLTNTKESIATGKFYASFVNDNESIKKKDKRERESQNLSKINTEVIKNINVSKL